MKKIGLVIIVLFLIVVSVVYVVFTSYRFRLVSTSPRNNDSKVDIVQPVIIKFNKPLATQTANGFSINPRVQGKVSIEGSQLTFRPTSSYQLNTTYTITLKGPTDTSSQVAPDVVSHFTPSYIPANKLSKDQAAEQAARTDRLQREKPLLQYLPHETLGYKIDYSVDNNDSVKLTITLYAILNRPSQLDAYHQQLKQFKTEALDYIKAKGGDPTKYQIDYTPPEAKAL